jgi:tetratricopeptide (TPR) repeat protein
MRRRRLARAIVACAILVTGTSFIPQASRAANAPSDADISKSFEKQIARLDATAPRSPDALLTHLRYADYLAKAQGPNCAARLNTAQSQLQSARQNAALGIVVPQGLARAADVEYQIHTALASCGDAADAAERGTELRAALESAQRSASLYEDTFDFPATLTMLFNAAVTYRSLGDAAAAVKTLESVISADREFGFYDDAEENHQQLLEWTNAGVEGKPAEAAAPLQAIPEHTITLKLAWAPGDSVIALKSQSARVIGNAVLHASGDLTVTRHVRKRLSSWDVTYDPLGSHYALEPLPADSGMEGSFMAALAGMLLQFHDFSLEDAGSEKSPYFSEAINSDGFNARVREGTAVTAALAPVLNTMLQQFLDFSVVNARTALDYDLETGAWAGATLQQGQWYSMNLMLPLPFMPMFFVAHQVQFAFTRELACSHDSDRTCVELVLRAVPDETDLKYALRRLRQVLHQPHGRKLNAWSTMYMRLITDPDTLQAYHRDTRQFFYLSMDGKEKGAVLGSDQSAIDLGTITPATP